MIRRILMTGDTVGGVWTFTMELAEALGAHGVEVVLAALGGPPSRAQRAEAARIANLDVLESGFQLEWMDDPWRDVEESGRWLLDLEEEYAPDAVHLNSFGHGALPWRTPVLVTAHSCVLSWWRAVKGCAAPKSWDRYRALVTATLDAADMVTAPSRAMADAVAEHYGAGEEARMAAGMPAWRAKARSLEVIPNGRSASRFARAVKEPFILTAGRLWDEAKNVGAVAKAAERIDWPVYVAGEAGRELPPCVMLGRLGADDLAGWYARAAIYALPARYEPFGFTALEAAHSGCALTLGDIPSLREIWGDAAVFVAPEDTFALEERLRGLIGDPEYRQRMADAARERAMSYTPRRMGERYLAAYQAIAERRHACAS